jgi:hypothetical protein
MGLPAAKVRIQRGLVHFGLEYNNIAWGEATFGKDKASDRSENLRSAPHFDGCNLTKQVKIGRLLTNESNPLIAQVVLGGADGRFFDGKIRSGRHG